MSGLHADGNPGLLTSDNGNICLSILGTV